jgi:radical SAM protein with 4Fe4S-binding SPASM domain
LQLPLYLMAAEHLLAGVTVDEASYLYFTLRGGYQDARFTRGALEENRNALTNILQCGADMIRDGIFAQNASDNSCRGCEYRPICGNGIVPLAERKLGDARLAAFQHIKEPGE